MLSDQLFLALKARANLFTPEMQSAFRLFAGFYEGDPNLTADLYGRTLLLTVYGDDGAAQNQRTLSEAQEFYLHSLSDLDCVLQKHKGAANPALRRGQITYGDTCSSTIVEHGIRYAIDLQMNQDASFYLDTRNLRAWLLQHARGKQLLNTFAYTGSLGVAALAAGAERVHQTDLNPRFMELARRSAMLNHLDLGKMKLRADDFFSETAHLKKENALFDLGIIDPPFFSVTDKGKVDMAAESQRLINKVRPLICDGGRLVVINNALFVSGADFLSSLTALCADGYLAIEETIPIPQDITGYPTTICSTAPVDPAPFNHSTKIAVLSVRRKSA